MGPAPIALLTDCDLSTSAATRTARDLGPKGSASFVSMVRHPLSSRFLQAMILGYVLLAIFTRVQEARGAYTCGCDEDCWCKRPGLSLFRWVLPRWHKNQAIAAWKASQV